METKEIDAQGKILGRLATEVAIILRGKNKVDFAPNRLPDLQVLVYNLSGLKFSGDKLNQKIYYRHSGYPGSLKQQTLKELMAKNPSSVFRKAVFNMLPKNRLRNRALARLILKNNAKDK
ncbi:50S ribosomal protein L13 [Candidatus Berkelbacteria bacterium]|nr:50S ribosomal protein L13 [Candidatus Berkelbacteria bacterium]